MTISLLHIVVPTILVTAVLIVYMNSCKKRVLEEIGELRAQLEKLDNGSEPYAVQDVPVTVETPPAAEVLIEEKTEEKDTDEPADVEDDVSAYNTGKSGKIYTKEELELLIKE